MRVLPAAVAGLSLLGCSDGPRKHPVDPDAGADAAADLDATIEPDGSPGPGCFEPMDSCPPEHPHPGGPCVGDLSCPYVDELEMNWTYLCVDGAWTANVTCAGGCPAPPLAEICLDPFAGNLGGARVEIGPSSVTTAFRPFGDAEAIVPIVGPQGGVMLPFRLRVSGVEPPTCVGATITLTILDVERDPVGQRVTLHCGESLPIYAVVPGDVCERGVLPVHLDVDVAGLGSTSADVTFDSPGCFDC